MLSALLTCNLVLVHLVQAYKLGFGGCLVYYEEKCSFDDPKFYLYSKDGIHGLNPFEPILPLDFDFGTPTKILIHGYGGLNIDFATRNLTQAYTELGYNVIVVDWSNLSAIPCYPVAFLNTWHVAECTAVLSVGLAKLGLPPNRLHVLGFSLGAHAAGFASNRLESTLGIPYGRITGLDPALPLFATLNDDLKLDKSDATFVDVVHTSAGSFGKLEALGHVDFYVNGGRLQPNCVNAPYPTLCSHLLVGKYFSSTIRGSRYFGFPCSSILYYNWGFCEMRNGTSVLMGENIDFRSRGIYFVEVPQRPSPPPPLLRLSTHHCQDESRIAN